MGVISNIFNMEISDNNISFLTITIKGRIKLVYRICSIHMSVIWQAFDFRAKPKLVFIDTVRMSLVDSVAFRAIEEVDEDL